MGFEELRSRFTDFYGAAKEMHERSKRGHRGHGLDHDVTVAAIALKISPDPRTAEMAWCAAMIHSVDRVVEQNKVFETLQYLVKFLPKGYFDGEEVEEIFQAALRHEEPKEDDSLVKQVLMDADRLANVMLSGALRAAQWLYDKPAVEFEYLAGERNPETTWEAPRSALDGVRVCYQMLHPMRTPGGVAMRDELLTQLSTFVEGVEEQYRDLGLNGISL